MSILLERLNGSSSNSSTHLDKIQIPQLSRREKKPFLACFGSTRNWESALYQPTQWHNRIPKLMTLMCDSGVIL